MRWLVTVAWRMQGSLDYSYETSEIDEHPVDYLNSLHEHERTACLVFVMKLHPEDPSLEQ
jgi:hypothetical protein